MSYILLDVPTELCIIIYEEFDNMKDKQNYVFFLGEPILYEMHINYMDVKNKEINEEVIELTGTLYYNCRHYGSYGSRINQMIKIGDFFKPDMMDMKCPTLQLLIKMDHYSAAIEFIDKYPQYCYPEHITDNGYSTLMWIVSTGDNGLLLKFINTFSDNCNPGYINKYGDTALIVSCRELSKSKTSNSNPASISFELIKKFGNKCNIIHKNNEGFNALHYSKKCNIQILIHELSRYS